MKVREIKQKIIKDISNLLPMINVVKIEENKQISSFIFDLIIKIKTKSNEERILICEIKELFQPRLVREVSISFKEKLTKIKKGYPIIISNFLSGRTREILKEEGIGYLDLAGNCYLKFDNTYIEKIVNENPFVEKRALKTIFKPISSRILRVLTEEPKRKWKILELSRVANVSLGQTSNVCRKLIDEEYIKKNDKEFYILAEPEKLLDEWRENYIYTQNKMVNYYSFEQNLDKLMKKITQIGKNEKLEYALTLLSGASFIAPFIRGVSNIQMYISTNDNFSKWVNLLDLRTVESGSNISIIIPYDEGVFYKIQEINGIKIAGNIQLYLDLYNYPTRGKEQAEFLRKEKIKF